MPPFSFWIATLGLCMVAQFMHKAHQLREKGTGGFLTLYMWNMNIYIWNVKSSGP